MNLSPMKQRFVMHFGEMGARWGMNRTVGQMYAVLFLSDSPLCADDLVDALGVSRSNVSMGLKELQAWQLVRLQHQPDDRRDFFSTPKDLWEIVRTLADQRRAREVDPTLSVLRELLMEFDERSEPDQLGSEPYAVQRMREATEMLELFTRWHDEMRQVDTERLEQLIRLGSAAQKILSFSNHLTNKKSSSTSSATAEETIQKGA